MNSPQHPWNVLPKAEIGDSNIAILFEAVGRALSTWEMLESELARIFAGMCGDVYSESAFRAYGMITGNGGRIDMLTEAYASCEQRKNPPLNQVPSLLIDVRNFAARRNEIAHGVATHYTEHNIDKGYFLCPASYNSRKQFSTAKKLEAASESALFDSAFGKYRYNSDQISFYTEQFERLRNKAFRISYFLMSGIDPSG